MEILKQFWKSRKWICSTALTIVNLIANCIDIHDSLYNLTGWEWIVSERYAWVDWFVLIVAVIGLIYNWAKATNYKTRNDELSD